MANPGVIGKAKASMVIGENEPITTEVVVLRSPGTGTRLLVGDPGLRALSINKRLLVNYNTRESVATIGAIGSPPTVSDTIEESDCKIVQVNLGLGKGHKWVFQWKWKESPPENNLQTVVPVYWKRLDKREVQSAIEGWAERALKR
jgi:hypothetical protein